MFGAKAFSGVDIPDQTGKVFFVTGGTCGFLKAGQCRMLGSLSIRASPFE